MRLDQHLLDRLDRWREQQGDFPSRSEATRRLMERGLGEKVSISGGERLILTLLCDLHKYHKISGEGDPDFTMEAILGGHYWAFEWEMQGLFHGHIDKEQTLRDTVNYLDMWSFLEEAYAEMTDEQKTEVAEGTGRDGDIRFMGFDGNNETEHMSIARFLIEQMGRFTRFQGRSLNSHCPSIDQYRRMYSAFDGIPQKLLGRRMTPAEVISVINERIHPTNR